MSEIEIDNFFEVLEKDTPLDMVITAHIHLENLINQFLSKVVPDDKEFGKIDLSYSKKIRLSVAFGLKPELLQPLLGFGKIRNKFAHRLDAKIDKKLIDEFFSTFPEILKKKVRGFAQKNSEHFSLPKGSSFSNFTSFHKF